MPTPVTHRVLALAAILQATRLVKQSARTGNWDAEAAEACIGALFLTDPASVAEAYGGVPRLNMGLNELIKVMDGDERQRDLELTKYMAGLLFLERKLIRNREALATLREGLQRAAAQAEHFAPLHTNVIANLGDLYQRTISPLGPRIMVQGEPDVLAQPANQARIRALLLAGIRAAAFWRHHGGTKWQLLFQRRTLLAEARALLARPSDA